MSAPEYTDREVAVALCGALEHLRNQEAAGRPAADDPLVLWALEAARALGVQREAVAFAERVEDGRARGDEHAAILDAVRGGAASPPRAKHRMVIDMPSSVTIGDMLTVRGALIEASTTFVDWAEMYERSHAADRYPNPISAPGRILLAIAHQLGDQDRELVGE